MTDPRAARSSDLMQIARLEAEIFGANSWSRDAVIAEGLGAAGPTRHLVVSTNDGFVVGYAVLMCAGDTADVLRIAVQAEHRREGRAGALLQALVDIARSENCRRMVLEVAAENTAALTFYASRGFAVIGRRRGYYAGGVDALVLQQSL